MQKSFPISRQQNLVVQELKGETLIYDLDKHKAFCLNETAALVYQLCDGSRSIAQIGQLIGKRLNQTISDDLIWLAIDQLKKENLLEEGEKFDSKFTGFSRREAIRKVGLASVMALPVITALIAPAAAQAGSPGACRTNQQTCGPAANQPGCCAGLTCNLGTCEPADGGI